MNTEDELLKDIDEADILDSAPRLRHKTSFDKNEYSDDTKGSYKYCINDKDIREKYCTYKEYKEDKKINSNIGIFQPDGVQDEFIYNGDHGMEFNM